MSKSSEQLAAVREVLRHLDHPHRLKQNVLVRWHFPDADEPALGALRVRHAVESAIEAVPARQREIVCRCAAGSVEASVKPWVSLRPEEPDGDGKPFNEAIVFELVNRALEAEGLAVKPGQHD